jgi:hypothetical protein
MQKKNNKLKAKFTLEQATRAHRGEQRYCSTLSLTLALHAGGCSTPRPVLLPPGKTWYRLHRRMGGPQGQHEQVRKISPPPPNRDSIPDRQPSGNSLYRLSYPGPQILCNIVWYLFPDDDSMWIETGRNTQCYNVIWTSTKEDSILLVSVVKWLSTTRGTNSIKLIHAVLKNLQCNFAFGFMDVNPGISH